MIAKKRSSRDICGVKASVGTCPEEGLALPSLKGARTMILSRRRWVSFAVPLLLAGVSAMTLVLPAQGTSEVERGRAVYRGHCAACHGFDGNGNGPRAAGLNPPPTNFRSATVMRALSNSQLERAILAGKAGTIMKGYGTIFNAQDVAALVQYLRSLSASP